MKIRIGCHTRKIVLLIDNAGCRSVAGLELKNVYVLFLPPNTASIFQPLDAGIIASFKRKYKSRIVNYYFSR